MLKIHKILDKTLIHASDIAMLSLTYRNQQISTIK